MNDADRDSPAPLAWRSYLWLGLIVFFAHLAVTSGHLMSPDGELMYRTTEALALRGELHVLPLEYIEEAGGLVVPPDQTFATVQGRNGYFYAQYLPLQSVLSVPLVWLAELTRPLFAEWFATTLPNTYRHPTLAPELMWRRGVVVMYFNPLIESLTALLLMRCAAFLTGGNRRAGWGVALLWALTTVAWPHSRTYFTEPLAGMFALLALDQLLRWYKTPLCSETSKTRLRQMIVLGGALAAGIWTRMDSALLAFGLGLALAIGGEWKRRRESAFGDSKGHFPLRDYTVSGALVLGSYVALLAFNHWRFAGVGSLFGGGYSDQSEGVKLSTPLLVGLHGLLMSPGKGLFFFSPGLLLGIWGWRRAPRDRRWALALAAGGFLPFAFVMVKWQNWDGGWCWGPRHLVQLHIPLMLGAAFVLEGWMTSARRITLTIIAIVGGTVQLFGSLQSPLDYYHEMFLTPNDDLAYTLSYRGMESAVFQQHYRITILGESGQPIGIAPPAVLPAPMVESLYVPQHSQWNAYPLMLKTGYCDWWLLAQMLPEN